MMKRYASVHWIERQETVGSFKSRIILWPAACIYVMTSGISTNSHTVNFYVLGLQIVLLSKTLPLLYSF